MKLDVIKGRSGYRIISYSHNKHPLLTHLAICLKASNKIAPIKIGIYSISGGEFSMTKRVYSYISDKVEHMDKKKFYRFMNGKATLKAVTPWTKILKMPKKEALEIEAMFSND